MRSDGESTCVSCGGPLGTTARGIPTDEDGRVVPNTYPGTRTGMPACESCYQLHRASGSFAISVLAEYKAATQRMQTENRRLRDALAEIERAAHGTLHPLHSTS